MAATPSTMMPLGTQAPSFTLKDTVSGNPYTLATQKNVTVVAFICNHCPYVVHIVNKLAEVGNNVVSSGGQFVAISSNDVVKHPDDSPELMKEFASANGFTFPYLYDETQDVARAYSAACTPDLYVFDKNMACVYRGRFDEATPGNGKPVTGNDLMAAITAVMNGTAPAAEQIPSIGCNIKWK